MPHINIYYGRLFKMPRKVIKHLLSLMYPLVIKIWPLPRIKSIPETIQKIIEEQCSIVRFGDSEFLFLTQKRDLPYQRYEQQLADKLLLILRNSKPNILVGLPYGYMTLSNMEQEQVTFWRSQIVLCYPRLFKYFDRSSTYYNANVTRLYFGYKDKSTSSENFKSIMSIWYKRRILLLEGEKSRMGVGNDLFEQVESLERILCPYHHAFSRYEEILGEALKHDKGKLILVSLGPAAKALAFELANRGYQVLDIGNLDIEYEWFRKGVTERIVIPGKYTSEVAGGRQVQDVNDSGYLNQVVARFI